MDLDAVIEVLRNWKDEQDRKYKMMWDELVVAKCPHESHRETLVGTYCNRCNKRIRNEKGETLV